jgi:hypothetical protein
VAKQKETMNRACEEACNDAFDAGWDIALDEFEKEWTRKPNNISREELILWTDRLLKGLREI